MTPTPAKRRRRTVRSLGYALLTYTPDGDVEYRRLFLTMAAAVRAQERAQMRGKVLVLVLVELKPVSGKARKA
jgi:hypothetical protein